MVHIDPSVGVGCPFCIEVETVFHLFVQCTRLNELFTLLSQWFFLELVKLSLLKCLFMVQSIQKKGKVS